MKVKYRFAKISVGAFAVLATPLIALGLMWRDELHERQVSASTALPAAEEAAGEPITVHIIVVGVPSLEGEPE